MAIQIVRFANFRKILLISSPSRLCNNVKLFRSIIDERMSLFRCQQCLLHSSPRLSKSPSNKGRDDQPDEPVRFSTSEARTYKARENFIVHNQAPQYQMFSVVFSIATILIYFCILREENDMDEELNTSLYQRIPGLEESQLKQSIAYNKEHGKSIDDLEKRLTEVLEEKYQARQESLRK